MKTGLVLEGGALRGLFTAGALDFLQDKQMNFDYIAGVSAGAGNMMNFISHQRGRTKQVIMPGKENSYYGLSQVLKTGYFLNLDKMIIEFSYDLFPYDFEEHRKTKVEHEIVVVNCNTSEVEYIDGSSEDPRMLAAVKASCSVPLISPPVEIDGSAYMDGSLVDSIPYHHAFEKGCDKLVIIMTKKADESPTDYSKWKFLIKAAYGKKYPKFTETLLNRAETYRNQANEMEELAKQGKIFILRPELPCISKFEKDTEKQDAFYQHGYDRMEAEYEQLLTFMKG